MPDIHQMEHQLQRLPLQQVASDIPPPPLTLGFWHLGVPESGQIDQKERIVDPVVVHLLGFSGCITGSGELLPVGQTVDQRRFAHIGAAGHTELGQVRRRSLTNRRRTGHKFALQTTHQSRLPTFSPVPNFSTSTFSLKPFSPKFFSPKCLYSQCSSTSIIPDDAFFSATS